MQMPNSQAVDRVGTESFYEPTDFPTEEELWAALEARLEPSPRAAPVALDAASRNLAQRWQELAQASGDGSPRNGDDHYLSSWEADQTLNEEMEDTLVEPDLLIDLINFLLSRLTERVREIRQAQQQLTAELAKLRS